MPTARVHWLPEDETVLPARLPASRLPRLLAARRLLLAAGLLGLLPLAGCGMPELLSPPAQARGNRVAADQLAQLVPGTSTQVDVLAVLGSPTARGTFDDNTWIYVGELTKPVIGATNKVEDQQAVAMVFDRGGVLREVTRKGMDDALPVDVVSRTTPTPGNDANFLQQLLGNVGRFGPGGTIGSSGSRGPSNF